MKVRQRCLRTRLTNKTEKIGWTYGRKVESISRFVSIFISRFENDEVDDEDKFDKDDEWDNNNQEDNNEKTRKHNNPPNKKKTKYTETTTEKNMEEKRR